MSKKPAQEVLSDAPSQEDPYTTFMQKQLKPESAVVAEDSINHLMNSFEKVLKIKQIDAMVRPYSVRLCFSIGLTELGLEIQTSDQRKDDAYLREEDLTEPPRVDMDNCMRNNKFSKITVMEKHEEGLDTSASKKQLSTGSKAKSRQSIALGLKSD